MSVVFPFEYKDSQKDRSPGLLEDAQRSLEKATVEQIQVLSTNFFDEVDDFLFRSGQQGYFAANATCLKAMREFRTKKKYFEDSFSRSFSVSLRSEINWDESNSSYTAEQSLGETDEVYEKVEVDLAIQAMFRKARKHYSVYADQISSICKGDELLNKLIPEKDDGIIKATLLAFNSSQHMFSISLDVRLLLLKLFEQHFLLKMEKIFTDTINLLNRYSEAELRKNRHNSAVKTNANLDASADDHNRSLPLPISTSISCSSASEKTEMSESSQAGYESVEIAVNRVINRACDQNPLPQFVVEMIRTKWRGVMFLIGLNSGLTSVEWSKAKHALSTLCSICASDSVASEHEIESLNRKITQGFQLIQIDETERRQFFDELNTSLGALSEVENKSGVLGATVLLSAISNPSANDSEISIESTISHSGEEILDGEDLDEIAKLMNTTGNSRIDTQLDESSIKLADEPAQCYLQEVDQIRRETLVDYQVNGLKYSCNLLKTASKPAKFLIRSSDGKISISRNRVELAISIQSGEIRLPTMNGVTQLNNTVLDLLN